MVSATSLHAQLGGISNRFKGGGGGGSRGAAGKDSLKHRTGMEDSITINYRFLDSSRYKKFDSSISDFTKKLLIPASYFTLGNTGSAAKSLLFTPILKAGWDAGFHAYDIYRFRPEDTKFYNTTRPYTELGYIIGSQSEQVVHALHTQNINPNWNVALQYRLINSYGFFKNQNTSQNNYQLSSFYQSPTRRYHLFFVMIGNTINSAENGGIINEADLDDLPTNKDRKSISVYLGTSTPTYTNPLSTVVTTGSKYKFSNLLLRQQYDLGKKDSIQTDSVVIHLFYPKLRLEHTFQLNTYTFSFSDGSVGAFNDTNFYRPYYNFISMPATYLVQDKWNEIVNDFSVYQYPDAKNSQQFIKLGASLQNLKGRFDASSSNYHNTCLHAEYRNKTKNQKWDVEANGELYFTGFNTGDYNAYISLKRLVSKEIGYLQLGFQNVNRSPSFIFNSASSFNFSNAGGFSKENYTRLFASLEQPRHHLRLTGNYYLLTNYSYFTNFYHAKQNASPFNLLQISAEKEIKLTKHLKWDLEITLQQKAGNGPVNVPLLFTRNRIGYEGKLGFKNLIISTGVEIKYNTAYKADGYSPLQGQFYYQDSNRVSLRLPYINGYLHFRVRSFTAYIRGENLNTARVKGGFGFTNNNLAIAGYPTPGLQFRVGIFWSFVN